ncbi:hypothetical protein SADUNF_Sadunf11G0061500 [Salix dunnii]|uniref:Uncharacterized protein n=1 Tax=Salix dunnii TaxID=1413687 RepID=A0A835MP44_9ROSI|nr:hypothetical protein SADUNF_Sadunf11G0061500 [Salix dunnii]
MKLQSWLASGGFERTQELAREKVDLAIQNLKYLPRGSYQSTLEEMVRYKLEQAHEYNTSYCTISLEHRAVAEELRLCEEHEYTTERAQKSRAVKPLPKPFLLRSKQSFVQRIFEGPIQMGGMRLDSLLPLKHLQQTSLRHHHPIVQDLGEGGLLALRLSLRQPIFHPRDLRVHMLEVSIADVLASVSNQKPVRLPCKTLLSQAPLDPLRPKPNPVQDSPCPS